MANVGESTAGNVGKLGVGAVAVGGEGIVKPSSGFNPFVPCPNMNFVDAFALNSSGAYDGMELTVTNDGVGGGIYFGKSLQNWISSSGKISVEITFDSSTDLSDGNITIGLAQGSTQVVLLQYSPASGIINDVNSATLATVSPTIGQFTMGFTLDQATGTATYSYKLSNGDAATANASLDVAVAYDNSLSTYLLTGSNTPVDGVNVVTINAGQSEYVTNVDGTGYCHFDYQTERYWLYLSSTGYVTFSSLMTFSTNWTFSVDTYLPSNTAQYDVITSNSSYYLRIYNNNHATTPNAIEIKTTGGTYTLPNSYPTDRSASYELSMVCTANELEIFIDSVSVGTLSITGNYRVAEAFFACTGCVFGNLNMNNAYVFPLNQSSGNPTASAGDRTATFTGVGQQWLLGNTPETAA